MGGTSGRRSTISSPQRNRVKPFHERVHQRPVVAGPQVFDGNSTMALASGNCASNSSAREQDDNCEFPGGSSGIQGLPILANRSRKEIGEFSGGADGGGRAVRMGFFARCNRRANVEQAVDVGAVHLVEKHARIGREGLDITPLSLRANRVSKARDDLPDPERPVMAVTCCAGMRSEMFLRLFPPLR